MGRCTLGLSQKIQCRAVSTTRSVCAVVGELYELRLQPLQGLQLAAHIEELVLGQSAGLRAGPLALELQQSGNLIEREAHTLGTADELQSHHVGRPVTTHAAQRPRGLLQQTDTLVIAHCLDVHIGGRRQSADGEGGGHA